MTWASFATRSISFVFVLPLLLRSFPPGDLAVWYIFATLASLQILAEIGFGSTFVRFVAYAHSKSDARVETTEQTESPTEKSQTPEIAEVVGTMNRLYWWLTVLLAFFLAIGGTLILRRPLQEITNPPAGWIAWMIVYATTLVVFRGNYYSTWLQGTNQIAILRRWETLISLASISSSIIIIKTGHGLLPLVAATQLWACAGVITTAFLATTVLQGRLRRLSGEPFSKNVFNVVWPSAWRSALGIFMSQGVTQFSGLLYAQVGSSKDVAAYLLAVRLQQTLASMANAPFYSKIPTLARLWLQRDNESIVRIARRSMAMALWAFTVPMVILGFVGPFLFHLLQSKTPFPPGIIWGLLGAAGLTERYGAMHLQLFSLSNKIVWHIANGVTGGLFVLISWIAFPFFYVTAIPFGMVCANLGFYSWYCSRLSHRMFRLKWPAFDLSISGGPILLLAAYFLYINSN